MVDGFVVQLTKCMQVKDVETGNFSHPAFGGITSEEGTTFELLGQACRLNFLVKEAEKKVIYFFSAWVKHQLVEQARWGSCEERGESIFASVAGGQLPQFNIMPHCCLWWPDLLPHWEQHRMWGTGGGTNEIVYTSHNALCEFGLSLKCLICSRV